MPYGPRGEVRPVVDPYLCPDQQGEGGAHRADRQVEVVEERHAARTCR
ncbi:hypothetical protein ABZY81_31580 [Streptomyces sp. NPDC006514]